MGERAAPQLLEAATRTLHTEQRDHGRLADGGVAPEVLPGNLGIAGDVQKVVLDLEGEAQIGRVAAQRRARGRRAAAEQRARLARAADQGTGLEPLQLQDLLEVERPALGE